MYVGLVFRPYGIGSWLLTVEVLVQHPSIYPSQGGSNSQELVEVDYILGTKARMSASPDFRSFATMPI